MTLACSRDFHRAAQRRLPRFLYDYIDGGAYDERTMRSNVDDLARIVLRQRVLRDVSRIDTGVTLFGRRQAMPVGLGPVGIAGMCARRGETQAVKAACDAGIPFCLSTVSLCSLEEVAQASAEPLWFQLYVIRDRGFMREMLQRAQAAGAQALVFTVDMPVPGARYRDAHSGMTGRHAMVHRVLQAMAHPRWAWDVGVRGRPHTLGNLASVLGGRSGLDDYVRWLGANFDPSIRWQDLDFLRANWQGTLILKGVLDPDDARAAADTGADGIVVSNHGGRQLDGVLSSARALPPIADAVADKLTILADGGVRSGLDVVRMLALGAHGVLLGRAWAFALAAGGGNGVRQMLQIMEQEMRIAMALTGVTQVSQIDRSILAEALP